MDGTAAWAATATTDREEPTGAAAAKLAGGPESGPATGSTRSRKARKQQIVITLQSNRISCKNDKNLNKKFENEWGLSSGGCHPGIIISHIL